MTDVADDHCFHKMGDRCFRKTDVVDDHCFHKRDGRCFRKTDVADDHCFHKKDDCHTMVCCILLHLLCFHKKGGCFRTKDEHYHPPLRHKGVFRDETDDHCFRTNFGFLHKTDDFRHKICNRHDHHVRVGYKVYVHSCFPQVCCNPDCKVFFHLPGLCFPV